MKIFLDTANVNDIQKIFDANLLYYCEEYERKWKH